MNASSLSLQCNVLLFAAGLGTRLRPFTLKHPKPALPLFGIPLGYYTYPYLKNLNVDKFVVNTFYLSEQIHQLYLQYPFQINFSDETGFIKGSAGGLKQAASKINLKIPTLLLNADEVLFTREMSFLEAALKQHLEEKNLATLVVCQHPEAGKKFGAIWCEENRVIAIGKTAPSPTAQPWHFIGAQFVNSEIINFIEPNMELNIFYDVLINLLDKYPVNIFKINCDWYEIGNPTDYHMAKLEISQKLTDSVYIDHFKNLNDLAKSELSDLTK